MRKEWTTTEVRRLKQLYELGLSHSEISEALGRPWSSIKHGIYKYGLKRDPKTSGVQSLSGVGSFFCAAHRDKETGQLHGHTWDVVAWFKTSRNAVELKAELQDVLKAFDHKELSFDLSWGEAIATEIIRSLNECVEVEVRRESERIYAKVTRKG